MLKDKSLLSSFGSSAINSLYQDKLDESRDAPVIKNDYTAEKYDERVALKESLSLHRWVRDNQKHINFVSLLSHLEDPSYPGYLS